MWPWGHALVGYVVYTLLVGLTRRRPLDGREALLVVLGTQLPDLVDKPLGWTLAVLPSGRSLGHSVITWTVFVFVLLVVTQYWGDRRDVAPVIVGALVGILTDIPSEVFAGEFSMATFVLWPVLPSPEFSVEPSLLASLGRLHPPDVARLLFFTVVMVALHFLLNLLGPDEAAPD